MRSILLVIALVSTIAASGSGAVIAQTIAGSATVVPGGAPIGHLQPRAQSLSPLSAAEQAEQQKMSAFDAEQQKMDADLDKHLNICRRC